MNLFMNDLSEDTFTFLFTDIEDSIKILNQFCVDRYGHILIDQLDLASLDRFHLSSAL